MSVHTNPDELYYPGPFKADQTVSVPIKEHSGDPELLSCLQRVVQVSDYVQLDPVPALLKCGPSIGLQISI